MMLLNDVEYQNTKLRIEGFKKALAKLDSLDNALKQANSVMWQLNKDALESMIDDFTNQVQEYEQLINQTNNQNISFEINSIEELPLVLIKARIVAGISQKELAERLGISEQLLKKYEEREYESANLSQLLEVSRILGIYLEKKITVAVA
jgi:HTH-type transcriptional regulator / antitoxin HipB